MFKKVLTVTVIALVVGAVGTWLLTVPSPPPVPPAEVDEVFVQVGHLSRVYAVAFSPDGKTALSGSYYDTVKWWDLSTGSVIKSLGGHSDWVFSVAFAPDGKTALSGSLDATTRLWNLQTGEEILRMVCFKDGEGVAIMPQGYYAASPNGEQYINVRVGNRSYGIDKYKTFYHRPDIVQLALQLGDAEQAIAQANQAN
jgi:WD40 repeat protein